MGAESFKFGAEEQGISGPAVVERLLPEAIAAEGEFAAVFIPKREGEHAVEAPHGSDFWGTRHGISDRYRKSA